MLKDALEAVESGSVSYREAAKLFGVSTTVLHDRVKARMKNTSGE